MQFVTTVVALILSAVVTLPICEYCWVFLFSCVRAQFHFVLIKSKPILYVAIALRFRITWVMQNILLKPDEHRELHRIKFTTKYFCTDLKKKQIFCSIYLVFRVNAFSIRRHNSYKSVFNDISRLLIVIQSIHSR